MRKYLFVPLILFYFCAPAFAFLDLLTAGISALANQARLAKEELFQDTMIKNTIDSLGVLQRNYQEATAAGTELKKISSNPNALLQDSYNTFMQGFGNPEQEIIDKVNAASQKQKGVLGQLHDKAMEKELNWIDSNIQIAKWMKDKVQAHNKSLEKAALDLQSTDKGTVESAKNLLLILSTECLVNEERMIADLMQQSSEQAKQTFNNTLYSAQVQKSMLDSTNQIYSNQPYSMNETDRKQELLNRLKSQPGRSTGAN